MRSVAEAEVSGQKVIVRADLDLAEKGDGFETFRLDRSIPTFRDILDRGGKLRLIAHRGRPNGVPDPKLSLEPLLPLVSQKLGTEVKFGGDLTENTTQDGAVILFENLRFNPGEEGNSPEFTEQLVALGQIFVNEAFDTCHRSHASVVGIPKYRPHFAGLNLIKEVATLTKIMQSPERPLVVVVGGAKIETKKPLLDFMSSFADRVLVGGKLMDEGVTPSEKVMLPTDNVDGKDIGRETITRFKEVISSAKTVVWNGPMGVFEEPAYANGTIEVARAIISGSAFSVVGGGDTVAALDELGLLEQISFVSTGGGAMLDFLAGKTLPGLEALE